MQGNGDQTPAQNPCPVRTGPRNYGLPCDIVQLLDHVGRRGGSEQILDRRDEYTVAKGIWLGQAYQVIVAADAVCNRLQWVDDGERVSDV